MKSRVWFIVPIVVLFNVSRLISTTTADPGEQWIESAPITSGFSPAGGRRPSGTPGTITDGPFTGVTTVRFNGVNAVFTVNSTRRPIVIR